MVWKCGKVWGGLGKDIGFELLRLMPESSLVLMREAIYRQGPLHTASHTCSPHIQAWEHQMAWDTNPLYVLMHEAIYCQGAASNWSAHRIRETEFKEAFDAEAAVASGRPIYFTGRNMPEGVAGRYIAPGVGRRLVQRRLWHQGGPTFLQESRGAARRAFSDADGACGLMSRVAVLPTLPAACCWPTLLPTCFTLSARRGDGVPLDV